jgi:hypothetical protein
VGEKTNKQINEGEMNDREVEVLGIPNLSSILPFNSVFYIMFPHNEKGVLWL